MAVAPTLAAAIKLHDDLKNNPEGVSVHDMDGRELEVERHRQVLDEFD